MVEKKDRVSGEPSVSDAACREWIDSTLPIHNTLKEIREEIDIIDEQIRLLIGRRLQVTNDAARFKRDAIEVPAPARQKEVLAKAKSRAEETKELYPAGYVSLVMKVTLRVMRTSIRLQAEAMNRTRLIR